MKYHRSAKGGWFVCCANGCGGFAVWVDDAEGTSRWNGKAYCDAHVGAHQPPDFDDRVAELSCDVITERYRAERYRRRAFAARKSALLWRYNLREVFWKRLDDYQVVLEAALQNSRIANENLTAVQARCTELLEENLRLRQGGS